MQPGHVVLDGRGGIVDADESFGHLLLSSTADLRGRNVLSFTAPADRDECKQAIAGLHETGRPFDITKRFIRFDGGIIWVRNSVSRMVIRGTDLIVATCAPLAESPLREAPAALLQSARMQLSMLKARSLVGAASLLSGPGWPALLQVYIAEAEGRAVTVAELADLLGDPILSCQRWVEALVQFDMLEVETRNVGLDAPKAYRLTGEAGVRLERYLAATAALSVSDLSACA